ncbi:unnamed protein product [Rotaria sordida]|uniref:EGF-like domain-containing protein n=1 Tax=Rotaria sordida TaxID=392033 RepID=A0A818P863_9BILA|nr:unnamed protein product [Rotaria sordida]CAF3616517.1 unnamed protein product [Rotaria sordida]
MSSIESAELKSVSNLRNVMNDWEWIYISASLPLTTLQTTSETILIVKIETTTMDSGICRPLSLNYECECLYGMYSGRHCEHMERFFIIRQYAFKSLAYAAILIICSSATFIIILDILEYIFHIDVTRQQLERLQRRQILEKRKILMSKKPGIAIRFIYINKQIT